MKRLKTIFLLIFIASLLFSFSINATDKPRTFPEKHAPDFSKVYWIADMGGNFGRSTCFAVWSADSKYIIFNKKDSSDPGEPAENMRLWIVNVQNHKVNAIPNSQGWRVVDQTWNTDSKHVLFFKGSSLFTASVEGGTAKKILGSGDSFIADKNYVCWIPYSTKVSYVKIKNDGYYLWAVDIENGNKKELFKLGNRNLTLRFIIWLAKGKKISYQMTVEPKKYSAWKSYFYLVNKDGSKKILVTPKRFHMEPRWDSAAENVVYSVWRNGSAGGSVMRDIYIYNVSTETEKKLTGSGDNYDPILSPDSRYVVYAHNSGSFSAAPAGGAPFRELKSIEIATGKTFSISNGPRSIAGFAVLRKDKVIYALVILKEKRESKEYVCIMMANNIRGKSNHKIFPGQKLTINMMSMDFDRIKFAFHYDGQLWGADLK